MNAEPERRADVHGPNGQPANLFPVVGVGASAGGLEAFTQLLSHLPDDTGMAFVLVQHLDPKHDSKLHDLLARTTSLPVVEVTDGMAVQPNQVYIIPRNTNMAIEGDELKLTPRGDPHPHLPIDFFFRSLAGQRRDQAIAIVLSGTGSDGTLGLREIKAEGGITFAQDEQSARFAGMPQNAVSAGNVDFVLTPEQIALELARIGKHPYLTPAADKSDDGQMFAGEEGPFRKVLALLRSAVGVDFTHYRDSTIKRRIMRRMALHTREKLSDYVALLESDRGEIEELFHEILINVTSFFRDPAMFEFLKSEIFPRIINDRPAETPIRVWTAGCSTGQEAYSIAMALLEYLDDRPVRRPILIFATDLSDSGSLDTARAGLYPERIEGEVSPERLRRFFTKEDGHYRINKSIRDICVFARQNITADPPFSRLDLISCRNLLIYLSPVLQKRVIPTFHYALNPGGFLMLGTSESVGSFTDLFEIVDSSHRIYSKKSSVPRQYPHFNTDSRLQAPHIEQKNVPYQTSNPLDFQKEADRMVLGRYAPAGVLVNESLEILQFRGRTSPYLEPAAGAASLNLLKMARDGLFMELKGALADVAQENETAERLGVHIRDGSRTRNINLRVSRVKPPGQSERCFLVLFEEIDSPVGQALNKRVGTFRPHTAGSALASPRGSWLKRMFTALPVSAPSAAQSHALEQSEREIEQLRRDLNATREHQQVTAEQHDAANEELKSASEEILSSNEELQSTNEELETAKEELQSINEELTTVNDQLEKRNQQLNLLSNDLTNLLASASIPIVMLRTDLCIRRFTPQAGKVLNLVPADVGRSINDVKLGIEVADLPALLGDAMETVQVIEREICDREGRWYQLRLHPYRTADNKIDGAVLVLLDIDAAKTMQLKLKEIGDYTQAIVQTVHEPLLIVTRDQRVKSANKSFYQMFRVTPRETENRFIYELGDKQWNQPALRTLLTEVLSRQTAFNEHEIEFNFPDIGPRAMLLNARRLLQDSDQDELILLAIEDITEHKRGEELLHLRDQQWHLALDSADLGSWHIDAATNELASDARFRAIFGVTGEQLDYESAFAIIHPDDRQRIREAVAATTRPENPVPYAEEFRVVHPDSTIRWVFAKGRVNFRGKGPEQVLTSFDGTVADITDRIMVEEALRESNRHKDHFLAMLGHELRNPLSGIVTGLQVLRQLANQRLPAQSVAEGASSSGSEAQRHESKLSESSATGQESKLLASSATGRPQSEELELFNLIARQTKLMTRLVDDLLDISRITAGKIKLRKERLNLVELVGNLVGDHHHHVEKNNLVMTSELPERPLWLSGDLARLSQVIKNLLQNATKFTNPGGSISVIVELDDDQAKARITVRDTGIGMDPSTVSAMFQPFRQADCRIARSRGGLGIGMALSSQLVQMHGGSITVHSDGLGHGSTFTIELPLSSDPTSPATPEVPSPTSALQAHRILIVEDQRALRFPMMRLLQSLDQKVVEASDGTTALKRVKEYRPEIVFCDIGLPDLDGYAVARAIRSDQDLSGTFLVAVTGYGQDNDRQLARQAGFDRHLTKPIGIEQLREVIEQFEDRVASPNRS